MPTSRVAEAPWHRRLLTALRPNSAATFIIATFLLIAAAGTAALMVPLAKRGEGAADVWHALFTAVSAVSVTGLTVVDTAEYWTPLGQVVILVLIQIGGLGIMTSTALLGLMTGYCSVSVTGFSFLARSGAAAGCSCGQGEE